jgi:hypothetical protein
VIQYLLFYYRKGTIPGAVPLPPAVKVGAELPVSTEKRKIRPENEDCHLPAGNKRTKHDKKDSIETGGPRRRAAGKRRRGRKSSASKRTSTSSESAAESDGYDRWKHAKVTLEKNRAAAAAAAELETRKRQEAAMAAAKDSTPAKTTG